MTTTALHPTVKDLAATFTLSDGHLSLSDGDVAQCRRTLGQITEPAEKKVVLQSLVALAARLMEESPKGAAQAVDSLLSLAADVVGDPTQTRLLFEQAGLTRRS